MELAVLLETRAPRGTPRLNMMGMKEREGPDKIGRPISPISPSKYSLEGSVLPFSDQLDFLERVCRDGYGLLRA